MAQTTNHIANAKLVSPENPKPNGENNPFPQSGIAAMDGNQTPGDMAAANGAGALLETVISSDARVRFVQAIRDLWIYRDLFAAFVIRDLKVRYKQTALGVIWVILQPLLAGGLFAMIFQGFTHRADQGFLANMLVAMAALVPWTSFASAVQNGAMSMEANAGMISKVYFPRMVIPGAFVCGAALDFLIAFAAFLLISVLAGQFTVWLLILMPAFLVIQMMAAMGIGLFFGALNAQYHDVKYMVPFILQMGMLVSVLVDLANHGRMVQHLLSLNPVAPLIYGYQCALHGQALDLVLTGQAALISVFLLAGGIWFFRVREAKLVDIL